MDRLTVLALEAQQGDQQALTSFVAETQADVRRFCHYLGNAGMTDDLTQETYERAIGSLHRFRGDSSARWWLLSIARRTCADATRRSMRRRRLLERLQTSSPADEPGPELATELDELLEGLDPDRRAAFVLTQVIGLRYEEAANALGCPVGTVRSRVARARVELAERTRARVDENAS
jgi:RNA polymerase sigma-70 factor (ECF subfamily)